MNTTPDVLAFLKELFQRLGQKTPTFFKIVAWISGLCTIITGLPGILDMLHIAVPEFMEALYNKTLAVASSVGLFISLLTVKDATQISTSENLPLTNKKDA